MYFDELTLGMSVDTAPTVIEKQKMMDFARVYDPIPLHTDEEYAKNTPFGKLIAPGVMSFMSVWAKYLEVHLLRIRKPYPSSRGCSRSSLPVPRLAVDRRSL